MHVLCDTSSVLMLLRIAPPMFSDPCFECVMTQIVHQEFVQTQAFKKKYPWRSEFRKHLKPILHADLLAAGYERHLATVVKLNAALIRAATGSRYNLSPADERIAAATISLRARITTGDANLAAFLADQFDIERVSPLGLVNLWLEKKLIEWDDAKQSVICDWSEMNEHGQPKREIERFKKLTGRAYPA